MSSIQHPQSEVPDDIWLVIAGNLGLDDLNSICSVSSCSASLLHAYQRIGRHAITCASFF
jgi:hypothetical protein